MCTSPTNPRMETRKSAFSLLEALVVLSIFLILATMALFPWNYERDKFARNSLRLAWQSEKDYYAFSYKGSASMLGGAAEIYTTDWNELFCKDLNTRDKNFQYTIEEATSTSLSIKATDKRRPSHYFIIDENGRITDETGRAYIINEEGKEQIEKPS